MLNTTKKISEDERAFLEAMINPDTLAADIADYAKTVSETGKLRPIIKRANAVLDELDVTLEELAETPAYADIAINQAAIRGTRQDAVVKLSRVGERVLEEIKKVQQGLELLRALDMSSPFLSVEQHESLNKVENLLNFITQEKIFIKHGRESWPRDLSNVRVAPLLSAYDKIVSQAYRGVRDPNSPIGTIVTSPNKDEANIEATSPLNNTLAIDRGLRKKALVETHFPESMREDPRLKNISSGHLRSRIGSILKVLDNDSQELNKLIAQHPGVLLDHNEFSSTLRRTKLLNDLALASPNDKASNYDPQLAKEIRAAFGERALRGSDKEFFEFYGKIRERIEADRADPNKRYPVINQDFVDIVSPKSTHPLANQDFSANTAVKFLRSSEYFAWKNDPFTNQILRKMVLNKLESSHIGAPREDWITANFKGLNSPAALQLKEAFDDLISEGKVELTNPDRPSKSGVRLAR